MDNWTEGYVSDIGYTFGYYPELNPLRIRLAMLYQGLVVPEVGAACELGYGQGLCVNIHAAASAVQWHGTDFNPAQAGMARDLAAACGAGAQLQEASFAEFCARDDLPEFDFIGLHGVWSWISADNRRQITDFIRRKLRVGGVVYISYNALPGWSDVAPLRKLLADGAAASHAATTSSRLDAALDAIGALAAVQPAYFNANPEVAKRFELIKSYSRNYLAHEYLNQDWHPMYFSDMAATMSAAKLSHACSAAYLDHIDALNLTEPQQALLTQTADPVRRQLLRDFIVNQQFRRDYWVKGLRWMTPFDQSEALRQQRVMLVVQRADLALSVTGLVGEARLNDSVYVPVLDCLADHAPKTLRQIEAALVGRDINLGQLAQAVMVLVGQGRLEPVQSDAVVAQARPRTDRLNQHLIARARGNADITWLASPVTGAGMSVQRVGLLFLLARSEGLLDPQAWAHFAWSILSAQGQAMVRDGKALDSAADNVEYLIEQAQEFARQRLPILQAAQVI